MATVELTRDNFDDVVGRADLALVDFWASWCAPCRTFAPIYERVSERHSDVVFGKVDTETQPELAASFQIASIPTLLVVRERVVLYSRPGALPEQVLEHLIDNARALDMDEVRRQLADASS